MKRLCNFFRHQFPPSNATKHDASALRKNKHGLASQPHIGNIGPLGCQNYALQGEEGRRIGDPNLPMHAKTVMGRQPYSVEVRGQWPSITKITKFAKGHQAHSLAPLSLNWPTTAQ